MASDTTIKQVLRNQAWQRALGELKSMRATFHDHEDTLALELDRIIDRTQVEMMSHGIVEMGS